jgi:hypothetical protein
MKIQPNYPRTTWGWLSTGMFKKRKGDLFEMRGKHDTNMVYVGNQVKGLLALIHSLTIIIWHHLTIYKYLEALHRSVWSASHPTCMEKSLTLTLGWLNG